MKNTWKSIRTENVFQNLIGGEPFSEHKARCVYEKDIGIGAISDEEYIEIMARKIKYLVVRTKVFKGVQNYVSEVLH